MEVRTLPVEIALRRLSEEEDGRRTYLQGGEEEFLVLPPQALIRPGASQVFRLQWVGEPMLQESASFMLFVSQVPVKWPANKTPVVQVVMSIGCMVNVAPPRGTADLRVSGVDIVIDKEPASTTPRLPWKIRRGFTRYCPVQRSGCQARAGQES